VRCPWCRTAKSHDRSHFPVIRSDFYGTTASETGQTMHSATPAFESPCLFKNDVPVPVRSRRHRAPSCMSGSSRTMPEGWTSADCCDRCRCGRYAGRGHYTRGPHRRGGLDDNAR
jgi:hypothetical protein